LPAKGNLKFDKTRIALILDKEVTLTQEPNSAGGERKKKRDWFSLRFFGESRAGNHYPF